MDSRSIGVDVGKIKCQMLLLLPKRIVEWLQGPDSDVPTVKTEGAKTALPPLRGGNA